METNKDKTAAEIQQEGNKVSGDTATSNSEAKASSETEKPAGEHAAEMPDESTKKEHMTGYNELPEQEKVGGE
ncbi:hypothetical protein [Pontibacter sp. SGAir0037]|uniref:hypothetical protein n=1 Tax=Pontibacter sp. SGAir0037 TaxID=2571030 RepID=UPI0010CD5A3F|nr:hypothetical protein [Pontibacter sp. SGAir0037]QCR22060.1 hypothetical protein C1N53_06710 [Pontibacter sp. SGAir0037]